MGVVDFRRYEDDDHARVIELHRLGLRQTGTDMDPGPWDDDLRSPDTVRATYLEGRGDFLVGVVGGEVVVMAGLREHASGRVEIKRMRVHPDRQRRGLGQAMLDRLERRAADLGYSGVYLDTTTLQGPAIALYRKNGYREVGRAKRGPFDVVLFEKDLGVQTGDAWGQALLDHLRGHGDVEPLLESHDGDVRPAMHPEWFFRSFDTWDWWERELLSEIREGPVLDLGCGAGRAALHFQDRGFDVTAVDSSPGAIEVCRRRGVADARVVDLNEPPSDRRWRAVLLLCGNLGLGGTWQGNRALLARLAQLTAPDAVLVGDSVNFDGSGQVRLRIRYGDMVTRWWDQRNVTATEVAALVEGTGWQVDRHLEDGSDHGVLLRRSETSARPVD